MTYSSSVYLMERGDTSMRILGINCMNHDAAMAVVDFSSGVGEVLWAAHAERYSRVKNDHYLNQAIVDEA